MAARVAAIYHFVWRFTLGAGDARPLAESRLRRGMEGWI